MPLAPEQIEDDSLDTYLASVRAMYEQLDDGASFSGHERNCVFLNVGKSLGESPTPANPFMANVSAVAGLDFADDGRGMVMVDWDHDGDLDVWLSNRTAPRLRFMRNNLPPRPFLSIRLQGKRRHVQTATRLALASR